MTTTHVAALDALLCDLAATKARPPLEVQAEAALHERLVKLVGPALDRIRSQAADGIPTDELRQRAILAELEDLADDMTEAVVDEAAEEAVRGWTSVERKVAAAAKQLPDELRAFGLDRKLFQSLSGVADRTLQRLIARTAGALTAAAGADDPTGALDDTFTSLLDFELRRMSRHTVRDAHQTATVEAEREFGVAFHQWVTAGDDQVRDSHAEVDGEIVRVGTEFSNGWSYPGQVGCRCRVEPWWPPEGTAPPGADRFTASEVAPIQPQEA